MTDCFIYDAVRTPRGKGRKKDGALADAPPLRMAKAVLQALPQRGGFDSTEIEDVILGCVEPVGEQGANVSRMAAMIAGYDERVPGVQLNRFCSSGLEAVNIAAAKVKAGDVDLIVGGGLESMSRVSMGAAGGAWSADPELAWGSSFVPQGIGADLIATKHGYSRADVDSFAVESQRRAAAAVLVGSREAGQRLGLEPRARILKSATVGSEPCIMLTGPAPASRKALARARMHAADIDLWEINEAFSAVCLLFMDEMGIDHSVTNVNGGAIAFGHPLGATGAMLLGTMLDELERRNLNTALITLCVGAGMGTSTIIERV